MQKADLDIRDQVAFDHEGRTLVGRVAALGDRTATVEIWNVGSYEVAYARLALRKKAKRRKTPSKATRELRAATGSTTAVAARVPRAERPVAPPESPKAPKKPKKSKKSKPRQPTWSELGLPDEGLIDLGIPDWEPEPLTLAPTVAKKLGKRKASKDKMASKATGQLPGSIEAFANTRQEKAVLRQWKTAAPRVTNEVLFEALRAYRALPDYPDVGEHIQAKLVAEFGSEAAPRSGKRRGRRGALVPQGSAELQTAIGKELNKLHIRKADERASVTAIAEKLAEDRGGLTGAVVQEAAIIHFGERQDVPKWMKKIDRSAVRKFRQKYTSQHGKLMTRVEAVRAGGKAKTPKFRRGMRFADYVHQNWVDHDHFLYVTWPEVYLNTKQEKAAFRTLNQDEAMKFIDKFERAYRNTREVRTTAGAFEAAMEKMPAEAQERAEEAVEQAKSKKHRLHMIARSAEAIENPTSSSNPRRKRKGKRKAAPANRRKIKTGQVVQWIDRYGQKDFGVVYEAGKSVSTVFSALTQKFGAQANRDLYPADVPRSNPASFTAKGERMYCHIRDSYAPRMGMKKAKEVAARTVYCRAQCAPGLVR